MTYLSSMFGADEHPTHVRWNGYILCPACSKGQHADHDPAVDCNCDLEEAS